MAQGKYELAHQIITLLDNDLAAAGFELLDVRVMRGGGRLQLRIFVDTSDGIDLNGCAAASRTAGVLLEEADLIQGRYVMEVSSPGIRRPLRKPDHFAPYTGERVNLKTGSPDRPAKLRGELVAVSATGIEVRPEGTDGTQMETAATVRLSYSEILEANLEPEFDVQALIQADRRRRKEERRADRHQKRAKKQKRRAKP